MSLLGDREVQPQTSSLPPLRGTFRLNVSQGTKYATDDCGTTKLGSSSVQFYIHIKTNKKDRTETKYDIFFFFIKVTDEEIGA